MARIGEDAVGGAFSQGLGIVKKMGLVPVPSNDDTGISPMDVSICT
ncbi:hypothetical protein [Alicyclobacillus dauci]|uniref:Uncharacterized protein n=1 Tax=Alicyclobacillus dauci TaxID=1475485 RepID=A0ABY6Z413_9BACL|nr:hypothetical protein [Alicyclobacillus dauci]WAH37628.1 hypothetical protein NZD86_03615 [Alicyclobacillus dauci]